MHLCRNCDQLMCKNIILSIKILFTEKINSINKTIEIDIVINVLIVSEL